MHGWRAVSGRDMTRLICFAVPDDGEYVCVPKVATQAMLMASHDAVTYCLAYPGSDGASEFLGGRTCEQGASDAYAATLREAIARAAIAVADAKRQQVEQNEAREVLQA